VTAYVLRPAPVAPSGAVVFIPGLGNRTSMVPGWKDAGLPVTALVRRRPQDDLDLTERGAEIARLIADAGLDEVTLLGHSLGGLVAFETARHLADRVARVVVVAQYPPHVMHRYTDEEIEASALPELEAGLAPELREVPDFVDVARSIWRSDLRAVARYRTDATISVPLRAVGARSDGKSREGPLLAEWARYTERPVETVVVDGGHNDIETLSASGLRTWMGS